MKRLLSLAVALIFICNFNPSFATHIPGANITYTCDPANPLTYTFTLTLFRVCPGTHPATMTSTYFTLTNTCGLTNPVVPTFNQVGVAEDVNQLCSSATSDCSGGTDPGLWKYTYEATITLPADCDSWTLAFDLCCRDQSSNLTGGTGNNMYVSTTMNTLTAPCNDSPVVTSIPMPYACTNTQFDYCLSIADPEGDSTYFSMITPMSTAGAPIVFEPGFSATAPLNNFSLDPLTGCISFNHPNTGNYVVAIQIDSYDDNGNLIASIVHDFQIIVMSCTNTPPSNPAGGIQNFSGTGNQLGANTVGLCYGDNICFEVVFEDLTDPGDNITIQQDGTTLLPGATFVQTGTNPATGTFCWTAQPGYTGSIVTFSAEDDGCPVMGTSGFAVDFNIATGVWAGPDPYICGSQTATLSANGATTYTWSPSTGLSCTNCPNPVASPATTTTYTLTGNLTGSCPNVDQVTVNVVPDYPLTMNPASQTICANEIAQLEAVGPGSQAPYTYAWSPSATLNNNTISNPLANPLTSTTYTVTMTSAAGCTKTATADVIVSGVGPTVTIDPSTIDICEGETVNFTTTAEIFPVVCGPSAGCTGSSSYVELGTATTASSTYSPFYGSSVTTTDYTKKIQYIYTAAELNALGYIAGTITDIALYTTTIASYLHDDVTIWIGCTSMDEFPDNNFVPVGSLTQVFGPVDNINPVDGGWTTFNISDWDWDGTSNLIIQFCAVENNQENSVGIESVRYTTTSPAYRCNYDYSSTVASCSETLGTRTTLRANMRFNMCSATVVSPTYSWSPGTGLSSTSVANPSASPSTTTSYVLNVTENGCTGSAIAQVNVSPDYTISPTASPASVCYGDPVNLSANLGPGGPYTYSWSPNGAFTNPSNANQTVTPTGLTTYYIQTSNGYCNKFDSVQVSVAGLPVSAFVSEDTVCPNMPVDITTVVAPASCGIDYSDCSGTISTGVTGTATTATSTYAPFYGSTAAATYTNRKQYIITAGELSAMGFTAGMITQLEMYISTTTGRSYDDLTIWMGCTALDQFLTSNFESTASMDQVYYNGYYTTQQGWNAFDITGFNWDGTSNIIIQICAANSDLTGSESAYYTTTTPYYRCMYYNTSAVQACTNATGTRTVLRPNIRVSMCSNIFGAGASYSWSPGTNLSDPNIADPTATVVQDQTYNLTVVDPLNPGCPSTASVQVAVDPSNNVSAAPDTTICPGDAYNLDALFSGPINPISVPCGIAGACSGANNSYIIGTQTGQNTSTSWPAPFGNWYRNAKHQFLFTAAELNAMGIQGGKINQMAFNVTTINGTTTYNSYQVSMGCTNTTSLTAWEAGLTQVKNPYTHNVTTGWNNIVFDTPYNWDGVSNLVVEICYDNLAVSYTSNCISPWTTTTFNASRYYYSDGTAACPYIASGTTSLNRPITRFTVCDPPPPVTLTYTWSPATDLDDPSLANPLATPTAPAGSTVSYAVEVNGGLCTVFDTVNVIICNPLPVELLTFEGYVNGEQNDLMWKTASELNSDYFAVQRSTDGITFEQIGTVDAAGTTQEMQEYRYTDSEPIRGVNYYRLREVDFDGTFKYSDVIALNNDVSSFSFFPNPTTNDLYVEIGEGVEKTDFTLVIIDISGKTISEELSISNSQQTYKVKNFSDLVPGVYIVQILNEQNELVKLGRITKQ